MSTNNNNIINMEIVVNNNANDNNDNDDGTIACVFSCTLHQKKILRLTEDEDFVFAVAKGGAGATRYNDVDGVVSKAIRTTPGNPWSVAAHHVNEGARNVTSIKITAVDHQTDNSEQMIELFSAIGRHRCVKKLFLKNVHLPSTTVDLDSVVHPPKGQRRKQLSEHMAVLGVPWRRLLCASIDNRGNSPVLDKLVISPGLYGATNGTWDCLWYTLTSSSLSSKVLECRLISVWDDLDEYFLVAFLESTRNFEEVTFYNFHLAQQGEAFTKAVGEGLGGSRHITSLVMGCDYIFPTNDRPNNLSTWLCVGGLDKNTSLQNIHLALGIGHADADALAKCLVTMMENRRRANDDHDQDPDNPSQMLTLSTLTLACSMHTSPITGDLMYTNVDPVMHIIGDRHAVPLRSLWIGFPSLPNNIQQSIALAIKGARYLEKVVVKAPTPDNLDDIHPELVEAVHSSKTLVHLIIGNVSLRSAGGLGKSRSRRAIRNQLIQNRLRFHRLHTRLEKIVLQLFDGMRGAQRWVPLPVATDDDSGCNGPTTTNTDANENDYDDDFDENSVTDTDDDDDDDDDDNDDDDKDDDEDDADDKDYSIVDIEDIEDDNDEKDNEDDNDDNDNRNDDDDEKDGPRDCRTLSRRNLLELTRDAKIETETQEAAVAIMNKLLVAVPPSACSDPSLLILATTPSGNAAGASDADAGEDGSTCTKHDSAKRRRLDDIQGVEDRNDND